MRHTLRGLGAALLLSACSSTPANGIATGSTCPQNSALTYENFGKSFIDTNCLACHASRERPTLTTQAAVQASRDAIDRAAAAGPNGTNTAMPQDHDVSVDQRTQLGEWLACGAP
jgi:mono/diheme cytochrome c family protein